ncbi:MAG: hypothetical protein ACOYM7_06705 [Paludibacter sp.]
MAPAIKTILYGIGVFSLFTTIALILKLVTHSKPMDAAYFGLFTNNDLMLGVIVAIVVTIAHKRKMKLK